MNHEMVPAPNRDPRPNQPAEQAVGELEDAVLGEPSSEVLSPDSAIDDLEAAVNPDIEDAVEDLDEVINPEVDDAIDSLESVVGPNKDNSVDTKTADELIDPSLSRKARALNKLDTKLRKTTLLIARQKHLETKTAKLEREYKKYPHGSRKRIRMETKFVKARADLYRVGAKQDKIFDRLQNRSLGKQEVARNYIYQEHAKDILIMRHKIAVEQKYRRKTIEKEKRAKSRHERSQLKSEIDSWVSMDSLKNEMNEEIKRKLEAKKATLLVS